jgi:hypothetical protein
LQPLTAHVVESVHALLEAAATIDPPLRAWRIELGCGHVISYRQHASLRAPDMLRLPCPGCRSHSRVRSVQPADLAAARMQKERYARLELRRAQEQVSHLRRRLARAHHRSSALVR